MDSARIANYRSWLVSAGIALVIVVWLLSGTLFPSDTADEDTSHIAGGPSAGEDKQRSNVRVRTQLAEEVQRTIVVNGNTAPARIVELAAETDGRIEYIGAERGSNVDRGQIIVRLDERDRRARLAQAKATVKQREVEFDGREKLKTSSYVSEAQLQEAIAALETARAELTRAELDLDYMSIRAPFDGALQARAVEVGDFVKSGDKVATFVDNRTMIVSANLSEFDAGYVQVGDQASAMLATGDNIHGRIRYVAPVADESTRTFKVELEVDNSDGRLRAGGTAELLIPAETLLAHRMSPSLLTLDDEGNVGVKIVNDENEVEFVVADIALAESDSVWVAGLPKSATLITVGQGYVADGAVVNAVPESDVNTAIASQAGTE